MSPGLERGRGVLAASCTLAAPPHLSQSGLHPRRGALTVASRVSHGRVLWGEASAGRQKGSVPVSLLIPALVCFQACAISGLFNCVTIHPLNIAAGVWMM